MGKLCSALYEPPPCVCYSISGGYFLPPLGHYNELSGNIYKVGPTQFLHSRVDWFCTFSGLKKIGHIAVDQDIFFKVHCQKSAIFAKRAAKLSHSKNHRGLKNESKKKIQFVFVFFDLVKGITNLLSLSLFLFFKQGKEQILFTNIK